MRFPVRFMCPGLGDLVVEPVTSAFKDWARAGKAQGRWPDGAAMARDLLTTLARTAADEALSSGEVEGLALEHLDAAGDAFLDASGSMLKPTLIATSQHRGRFRKRKGDEAYDIAPREGEAGSERLRRVVFDWLRDLADRDSGFADLVAPAGSRLDGLIAASTSFGRLAEQHQRLFPDYSRISGLGRLGQSLRAIGVGLDPKPSAFTAIAQGLATPEWMKATAGIGRFASIMGPEHAVLRGLTPPGRGMTAVADSIARATRIAGILPPQPGWANQLDFMKSVNRGFNLGLSLAAITAMTSVQTPGVGFVPRGLSEAMAVAPGFQLTAGLGLVGRVGRGVAADILHHYEDGGDEDAAPSAVFVTARDGARGLDDGGLSAEQVDEIISAVRDQISTELARERDPVRRLGLMEILLFILTFVGTASGVFGAYVGYESLVVGQESLALAQAQTKAPPDPARLGPKLDQLHKDLRADKAQARGADEAARYVHRDTPLRADPDGSGLLLRMVYFDQTLRVIDERGAWVKVEVYDYHAGAVTRGWMSRRRLRRTPLERGANE